MTGSTILIVICAIAVTFGILAIIACIYLLWRVSPITKIEKEKSLSWKREVEQITLFYEQTEYNNNQNKDLQSSEKNDSKTTLSEEDGHLHRPGGSDNVSFLLKSFSFRPDKSRANSLDDSSTSTTTPLKKFGSFFFSSSAQLLDSTKEAGQSSRSSPSLGSSQPPRRFSLVSVGSYNDMDEEEEQEEVVVVSSPIAKSIASSFSLKSVAQVTPSSEKYFPVNEHKTVQSTMMSPNKSNNTEGSARNSSSLISSSPLYQSIKKTAMSVDTVEDFNNAEMVEISHIYASSHVTYPTATSDDRKSIHSTDIWKADGLELEDFT